MKTDFKNDDLIEETFCKLVRQHLPEFRNDAVGMTKSLNSLGLDSITAINLLADLEEGLGIRIEDHLLTAELFSTGEKLYATVLAATKKGDAQC